MPRKPFNTRNISYTPSTESINIKEIVGMTFSMTALVSLIAAVAYLSQFA